MAKQAFNHWSKIGAVIPDASAQVVKKVAFDVQAGYQDRAHKDTCFMANSVYVVTRDSSDYGRATPTKPGAYLLPEVAKPDNNQTALIAVGANYAIIEEHGGVNHAANPALTQAMEAARPGLDAGMRAIEQAMKEAAG